MKKKINRKAWNKLKENLERDNHNEEVLHAKCISKAFGISYSDALRHLWNKRSGKHSQERAIS